MTPPLPRNRRERMLKMLAERSSCSTQELADAFGVTTATVRSDLSVLEREGHVVRIHGGAIARKRLEREDPLEERGHSSQKVRIARKALELVSPGDVISLDTGTTAIELARALVAHGAEELTVICPDLLALRILEAREDYRVVSLGGQVRNGYHFSCDGMTLRALDQLRSDKCFLTTTSFDLKAGFTTPNLNTAALKAKLIETASETIMLVDSTKVGRVSAGRFADVNQIDHLVIDSGVDEKTLAQLRAAIRDVRVA